MIQCHLHESEQGKDTGRGRQQVPAGCTGGCGGRSFLMAGSFREASGMGLLASCAAVITGYGHVDTVRGVGMG